MSARTLKLVLLLCQLVIGLGALMLIVLFAVHLRLGGPFNTQWPIVAQRPVASFPLLANAGQMRFDRGVLALASNDWKPEFAQLFYVLLMAAGANIAIEQAQRVLSAIAARTPFTVEVIRSLRVIGWLLIASVVIDLAAAFTIEPLLLSAARPADGAIVLASSFSGAGGDHAHELFRLHFDIAWLRIVAGLAVLALAEAFMIGRQVAEENEAIV